MPRTSNIKWRQSDRNKISRTVQQFNAKITRTLRQHPEWSEFLPQRLTVSELTNKISSRRDFNREINSAQRFLRKGAEIPFESKTGIKTTQWEKREVGYKVAQVNRQRTLEAKRANVSTTKGTMGSIKDNNLKPKKYDINKIRLSDWAKYVETVEKQILSSYTTEKMERYKQNYLKAIIQNLGTGELAKRLYDYVEKLDPEFMYNIYYDDPVLQIQFTSDPIPADIISESALEHWINAVENS